MKKINTQLLIVFLGLSAGFYSCSPSYTAHFNNDPFYKGENLATATEKPAITDESTPVVAVAGEIEPIVTVNEEITTDSAPDQTAVASKDNMIARLGEIPSIKKLVTEHKENVKQLEASGMDQKTLAKEIRKEEKRAHKEVKKQLIKEIKEVKKAKDSEAMNRKVYIGIIVAAAGIIVAILASGAVGAVAIIVGVGLIAWGLIEQGGV